MANGAIFCENCGQSLPPTAHFCSRCRNPVRTAGADAPPVRPVSSVEADRPDYRSSPTPAAQSSFQVPPAPQRQSKFSVTLPWIVAGTSLGALLLVLVAAAYLYLNSPRSEQLAVAPAATPLGAPPTPSPVNFTQTDPTAAVPTSTAVSTAAAKPTSLPSATANAIPATTEVNAASVPTSVPAITPFPTGTAIAEPSGYDLYVKRIDYSPAGANLVVGMTVDFKILLATNSYPDSGPYFPATWLRFRSGDGTIWSEYQCPASTQQASCLATVSYRYGVSGNYTVVVEADSRGEIRESDESNNASSVDLMVNSSPPRPTIPPPSPTITKPKVASVDNVIFSSDFDQNTQRPISPGTVFPYGTKIVYAWWQYSGVEPGTAYSYTFYKGTAPFSRDSDRFLNASGYAWQWMLIGDYPTVPLDPGNYTLAVSVNGNVIGGGAFEIQPPAVGGPIQGAFSVFFTIQNGVPTGWVYDKQGIKHAPASGTISGLSVAPGDRIVLQTDQARFSLLFDCSTTPGTFNPCDFMSDSTNNLPREIRAVKRGMSAFFNISRADNWAGERNGFPGQRYPADPVLRIMLSW